MNTTSKYMLQGLIAGVALFTSCKKLDVTPPDKLSTTIFWKSESDADLALTGIYNTFYAPSSEGYIQQYMPFWWDNYSDNSYTRHNIAGAQQALIAGLNANSGGFDYSYYNNGYIAIAAANYFLANVNKVLSGDKLKQYKGEGFFLRGFNYFQLAELYGNVPLVTEDPFTIDYKSTRAKSPRADILKQVENDFDSAIAYLPNVKYTTGHAVKATAMGYKVRMLLFEKRWAEAAALANQVITDNLFSLNTKYASNFYKPDQKSSPEIMFSVQFQAPTRTHGDKSLAALLSGPGWWDVQGTQDMIDEYESGDPRKTMTFFMPGDGPAQGWPYPGQVGNPGTGEWEKGFFTAKKWLDPTVTNPTDALLDDQDYVLLRYADIKLMYAEAQNEAVGPDPSVYQQVKEVRARQDVNMPALNPGLSQDDMRQAIRHERRVEFALEGLRYFDLRRWGIATQKLNGFVQNPLNPTNKTIYKDNYEFWPIPQTEIDRNKPVLIQNDGY
ncbi:MAG: RagB/SusD family nutrient uptake outer membrane protein [Chitinophagaceae bacterium]|nr:RagB/SusD family nutrient uptake outer membrane protein [Chitinophagaceae bacterium]